MKKTIVILGNSQLAFFVNKLINDSLGSLAHIDVLWITNTDKIFPVAHKPFSIKTGYGKLLNSSIKSVNLRDRRIITAKKVVNYDLLFIDQTPVFNSKEREKITDQLETLISTVRAKENSGVAAKARVVFDGQSADMYQLALNLAKRLERDSSQSVSSIRVEAGIGSGKLAEFFKDNGVFSRKTQYPGIIVKRPLPVFSSKKIRGLRVDLSGRAITLVTGEPGDHNNVIIVDDEDRGLQNIARADWSLAKTIAKNVEAKLDGGLEKPIETDGVKLLIASSSACFVEFGSIKSARARSRVILSLDRSFWSRFFR